MGCYFCTFSFSWLLDILESRSEWRCYQIMRYLTYESQGLNPRSRHIPASSFKPELSPNEMLWSLELRNTNRYPLMEWLPSCLFWLCKSPAFLLFLVDEKAPFWPYGCLPEFFVPFCNLAFAMDSEKGWNTIVISPDCRMLISLQTGHSTRMQS